MLPFFLLRYREFGVLISVLAIAGAFSALSPRFATVDTASSVLTITAEVGVVTIGVAFLMIAGEFDLSVGSVFAVSGTLLAYLVAMGVPEYAAAALVLSAAAAIGLANGLITIRTGIPSFIVTLGMAMFLRGLLYAATGGFPVSYKGEVLPVVFAERVGDFRVSGIWFLAVAMIFYLLLHRSVFGNWVYATGGNRHAAKAMGVEIERVKLVAFMLSALMAGLGGIMYVSRFKIVEPVVGLDLPLEAIAAAVIGGCSLMGGIGSIIGAALGAALVGMTRVGLVLVGAPAYWYITFIGIILIIAAVINTRLSRYA